MSERIASEAGGITPKVTEPIRRMQNTQIFLRMAVIELRRIAEQAPDMALDLRQVARQIEAEAEDLARDSGLDLILPSGPSHQPTSSAVPPRSNDRAQPVAPHQQQSGAVLSS